MGKGNTTSNDILKCILRGTDPTYRGGNATLYVSLHTTDPTASGNQTTGEVAYSNYTRMPITKASGWIETSPTNFTNAALIQFPICGAIGTTVGFVAIGEQNTGGSGQIYYYGAITSSLTVALNIQPQFSVGNLSVTES